MAVPKNKEYVATILTQLALHYPDAHCALLYENPFQLLVATILSAQCTDIKVNQVTPILFKKYKTPQALAKASVEDIEKIIKPTGFYKNKSKNLLSMAQSLVQLHQSVVPTTMPELKSLAGVGRKTANVVLGNCFGKPDGVVVDTHVGRITQRLGLTKNFTPEKIEKDLAVIIPKDKWVIFSHWLIDHGRKTCKARNPDCEHCFLNSICPKKTAKK